MGWAKLLREAEADDEALSQYADHLRRIRAAERAAEEGHESDDDDDDVDDRELRQELAEQEAQVRGRIRKAKAQLRRREAAERRPTAADEKEGDGLPSSGPTYGGGSTVTELAPTTHAGAGDADTRVLVRALLDVLADDATRRQLEGDLGRELIDQAAKGAAEILRRERQLRLDVPYGGAPQKRLEMNEDERKLLLQKLAARMRLNKKNLTPEGRKKLEEEALRLNAVSEEELAACRAADAAPPSEPEE